MSFPSHLWNPRCHTYTVLNGGCWRVGARLVSKRSGKLWYGALVWRACAMTKVFACFLHSISSWEVNNVSSPVFFA